MSYCLAIQTDHGLVFASDSRTHGGVDQVNAYSKMHRFEVSGERVFVLLSAGNLSTTQSVVHRIDRQFEEPAGHGLLQASWSATVAQGMRILPRFPWETETP